MPRPVIDVTDRLIVALDLPTVDDARRMVAALGDSVTFYKIGMQLVFAGGLTLIDELRAANKHIFLDMKLLDIDATVEKAARAIVELGVDMTTIHAYPHAMKAAVRGREDAALSLLGVTVLTSLDDADLIEIGYQHEARALVAQRAQQALAAGMTGLVASPQESAAIRAVIGDDLILVTPGVRPAGSDHGDQKRIMTPGDAIRGGSDYLVIGRPVTHAPAPRDVAKSILDDIQQAL